MGTGNHAIPVVHGAFALFFCDDIYRKRNDQDDTAFHADHNIFHANLRSLLRLLASRIKFALMP